MTAVTGLQILQGLQERGPASVGVANLLGMEFDSLQEGQVAFALRTRPEFSNPQGTLHGGITATLLDSALACSVLSALGPGVGFSTVDLSVTYLRPVALDGTALRAEAGVVHVGRTVAAAQGRVTDERGRLVATASTTGVVARGEPA